MRWLRARPVGDGHMSEWLASLRRAGPPADLGMYAADLVREARHWFE
jgi:hypothetical protein